MQLPLLSDPLWRAVFGRTALAIGITFAATAGGPIWTLGVGLAAAGLVAASIALRADALRRGVRELAATAAEGSPAGRDKTLAELAARVDDAHRSLVHARRVAERERDDVRGILEATAEGIVVVGHHLRVELINDAARRILEPRADPLGLTLPEVVGNEEIVGFAQALRRGEEPASQRLELPSDQAGPRWVHVSGAAIRGDHVRNRAVLVLHDLTDLRHLEKVRTDFVANVSHEMRSPLAAILGYAETLADDGVLQEEEPKSFLERIIRNARRLNDIIRDLIELSRLEHATEAQRTASPLAELVHAACAPHAEEAAEKGVAFTTDLGRLARTVELDADLLRQALTNLVDNAVKYTPPGGEVRITGRLFTIEDEGPETLELAVSDTGPGIPRDQLGRIFERFYRVDAPRSRALGGTGLGLAIVKHAVALHGGRVKVESTPGEGSTFRVLLPIRLPQSS